MFLTPLARLRLASRLCRISSWLVLLAGMATSLCLFVITYTPELSDAGPRLLLSSLALSGLVAMVACFFFVCLFSAGAFLEYVSTIDLGIKQKVRERSDEDVEITPLP